MDASFELLSFPFPAHNVVVLSIAFGVARASASWSVIKVNRVCSSFRIVDSHHRIYLLYHFKINWMNNFNGKLPSLPTLQERQKDEYIRFLNIRNAVKKATYETRAIVSDKEQNTKYCYKSYSTLTKVDAQILGACIPVLPRICHHTSYSLNYSIPNADLMKKKKSSGVWEQKLELLFCMDCLNEICFIKNLRSHIHAIVMK